MDKAELQGLVLSGYGKQRASSFVLLTVDDAARFKPWLTSQLPSLTFGDHAKGASKLNVALSWEGLRVLGASGDELDRFSPEFQEGMVTRHRQRILADLAGSPSDPERWEFGGPRTEPIHVALLLYELDDATLAQRLGAVRQALVGARIVRELTSTALEDNKEHFGFRDGIAQPWVEGLHKPARAEDRIAAGELVLGYPGESGVAEPAPPLATNGAYLVLRQLEQDVEGFWRGLREDPVSGADPVRWASKMVGRWPDGAPLVLAPERGGRHEARNDFGYAADPRGLRCPVGAHIRRANPRDGLSLGPDHSLATVGRHRILRRGRSFGLPASVHPPGLEVRAAPGSTGSAERRGLYFVCLNASISRQFEFVQQAWLNNPKFGGLSNETDPMGADTGWSATGLAPRFTAPCEPVNQALIDVAKSVAATGGAYLFLPGRAALQRLCGVAA